MTDEAKKALAKLKEDHTLVMAMKRSAQESDQKLQESIQEFLLTYMGIQKGAQFTLMDVIEKATK